VALGRPGEKVIAVLGDGSAMYAIQGLWSAAQLKLPIVFVIINNGRYEALHEFARHFSLPNPVGTSLPELDFCAFARAQGLQALRVDRPEDLDPALRAVLQSSAPILLEVVVDVP
jgi:benzoylformate decarboxylase